MNEKVIETKDLTKRFGNFTAVDRITFDVARGEIFGFLGANGAGKTTAMRMLCGLSCPTSGTGYVAGFDISTRPEAVKRSIGYMMDDREIARKSDEMLAELGFEAERDTFVRALPLGWKQKLAFSVSIFHEPKVVFLDEPTGGVDPITRRQFWELIYRASDRGITVFVTTHYMDEAEYCDRVSIMVDGQIRALDSPARLRAQFRAETMDDVFQQLARQSTRRSD